MAKTETRALILAVSARPFSSIPDSHALPPPNWTHNLARSQTFSGWTHNVAARRF